jgi:hypothetical protein
VMGFNRLQDVDGFYMGKEVDFMTVENKQFDGDCQPKAYSNHLPIYTDPVNHLPFQTFRFPPFIPYSFIILISPLLLMCDIPGF